MFRKFLAQYSPLLLLTVFPGAAFAHGGISAAVEVARFIFGMLALFVTALTVWLFASVRFIAFKVRNPTGPKLTIYIVYASLLLLFLLLVTIYGTRFLKIQFVMVFATVTVIVAVVTTTAIKKARTPNGVTQL